MKIIKEAMKNVPKPTQVQVDIDPVTADAKEFSEKAEKESKEFFDTKKLAHSEPITGHNKKDYPKPPKEPKATLDESLFDDINEELDNEAEVDTQMEEGIHDKGLPPEREGIFEFPNGEYLYVDEEDGTLFAGGATNMGIIHEFEVPYDDEESLDANLERLYDVIIEERPELLDEEGEYDDEEDEYDEYDESLNEGVFDKFKQKFQKNNQPNNQVEEPSDEVKQHRDNVQFINFKRSLLDAKNLEEFRSALNKVNAGYDSGKISAETVQKLTTDREILDLEHQLRNAYYNKNKNESLNEEVWSQTGEDMAALEGGEAGRSILIGLAKFIPMKLDAEILGNVGDTVGRIAGRHLYRKRNGNGQRALTLDEPDDVEFDYDETNESLNEAEGDVLNKDYSDFKKATKKSEFNMGGYDDSLVSIKDGKIIIKAAELTQKEAERMAKRINALASNLTEGVFSKKRIEEPVEPKKVSDDDEIQYKDPDNQDDNRYSKWTQAGENQAAIEGRLAGRSIGKALGAVIPGKLDDVALGAIGGSIGAIGGRHVYRREKRKEVRNNESLTEVFSMSSLDEKDFNELVAQYKNDLNGFIGAVENRLDDADAEEFDDLAYKAKDIQEVYELAQEFLYKNYEESLEEAYDRINYTAMAMKQQGLSEEIGTMRFNALNGDTKEVCESYLNKCNELAEQYDDDYVVEGLQYVTAGINLDEAKQSDKKSLEDKYLGKTIRIIDMQGEPEYAGREGKVETVDDAPQLHGTWGGLAVDPSVDEIEIIG